MSKSILSITKSLADYSIYTVAGTHPTDMGFIGAKEVTVPNTEQNYIEVQEKQKFDILCRLLDIQSPERSIIFGRTKKRVDEIAEGLNKRGYSAEGIHGDLTQGKRDSNVY